MFPDLRQMRTRLGELSETRQFRIGIAAVLACMHLVMFARAGAERLDLPFNSAPGQTPYYSNINAPSVRGYPRQPHHWSRLINARWDSQIYIGFAVRGVESCPKVSPKGPVGDLAYLDCGLGWMPAFGVFGGAIARITGVAPDVTLVFISMVCLFFVNLMWTSRAFRERLGRREAYGALIAFNVFPTAFYMAAPYTEAMTLALVLAGFLMMLKERWFVSSIFIGAATALRASAVGFGVGLCCAAAFAAWTQRRAGNKQWWKPMLAVPLSAWGLAVELLMLRIFVGDFFAFNRARTAFGDYQDYSRIVDPEFYLRGFTAQHMDSVMLFASLALLALVGRELIRRFKPQEAIFLIVSMTMLLVMSIAALHEYWGLNRYMLLCPMIFLGAGLMLRKHPAVFVLWLVLCAMIYWHVELCSYISHGNPSTCPCLGRFEFGMPFQS